MLSYPKVIIASRLAFKTRLLVVKLSHTVPHLPLGVVECCTVCSTHPSTDTTTMDVSISRRLQAGR